MGTGAVDCNEVAARRAARLAERQVPSKSKDYRRRRVRERIQKSGIRRRMELKKCQRSNGAQDGGLALYEIAMNQEAEKNSVL